MRPVAPAVGSMPLVVLALVLALVLVLAACSPFRVVEAVDVLQDVAAGPGPSTLKRTTPAPSRRAITVAVDEGAIDADLYEPGEPARAAMVLVPGATRLGPDDPRVVAFAETLARARFRVLVPDLPGLRSFRFGSGDAVLIAAAARDLAARSDGQPLGVAAVSFAAGPAVLALLDHDTGAAAGTAVDFAILIGGYYDITAAITYVTTGFHRDSPAEPWRQGDPSGIAKWAFVLSNLHRLETAADRDTLSAIAEARIADPTADVAADAARLGPEGQSVWALLENRDPDHVPALLGALPPAIRAEIAALDLARRDLRGLDVTFVLIHGRDDPILPASGSVALAAAVSRAHLYIVDALGHVDAAGAGLGDSVTLIRATHRVLELRDGW